MSLRKTITASADFVWCKTCGGSYSTWSNYYVRGEETICHKCFTNLSKKDKKTYKRVEAIDKKVIRAYREEEWADTRYWEAHWAEKRAKDFAKEEAKKAKQVEKQAQREAKRAKENI